MFHFFNSLNILYVYSAKFRFICCKNIYRITKSSINGSTMEGLSLNSFTVNSSLTIIFPISGPGITTSPPCSRYSFNSVLGWFANCGTSSFFTFFFASMPTGQRSTAMRRTTIVFLFMVIAVLLTAKVRIYSITGNRISV